MIVLAACGGGSQKPAVVMAAPPPPPPAETTPVSTPVATNDPAPPPPTVTSGDPCMGGEVTPATVGGPPAPGGSPATGGPPATGSDGTIGRGYGVGAGGGNACGGMRRRGHGPVVHLPANASVDGPLDKAIIRRYIKRNINKIQYCYERELQTHPDLQGTVTAKFVIGTDGLVGASEANGLAGVDTCIAEVIKGIEFPKPKGAKVTVVYPFTFATTE